MVSLGVALEAPVMSRMEAEVLIVGAGPAGAALGLELARGGCDVLILERARFPRDKPCGDCVNPGAVRELHRLGLADRLAALLLPGPLRGWRVEAPDGTVFQAEFGTAEDGRPLQGWAVRRSDFDAALLEEAERAGVRVRFGVRVFDVMREGGRAAGVASREGTSVRETRAAIVVGADGMRSVVQRRLGLGARPPRLRKIALVGHLADGNGSGAFGELRVRGGRTCGYAALGRGANVTVVIPEREAARIAGRPREFLTGALSEFPQVRERVLRCGLESSVMVTGPFDLPVRRPWAAGAVLVGDAAGYYDPFTGQGIHQALRSAGLAADAIRTVLRDPAGELKAFNRYGRRLRRELAPKRALQRVIEAVISRPFIMSRLLGGLGRQEAAAARFLRATGDLRHPGTLLDPVLWARLLFSSIDGMR